jgi:prepilin-type N-terminal cleavage/methylation domain-containing protein
VKRNTRKGFTLVELMVVIGILGLLVGILAVAVIPRLTDAKNKLEVKQVGDIMQAINGINADSGKKAKLSKAPMKGTEGLKFFEKAFKAKVLDAEIISKIVSLNGPDSPADKGLADNADMELLSSNCSYTAPKAEELLTLMKKRGNDRKVLLTFDSDNWANYPDHGVIVQWTDADTAAYIMADEVEATYRIDATTFANPKDVIGSKPPFDKTFE